MVGCGRWSAHQFAAVDQTADAAAEGQSQIGLCCASARPSRLHTVLHERFVPGLWPRVPVCHWCWRFPIGQWQRFRLKCFILFLRIIADKNCIMCVWEIKNKIQQIHNFNYIISFILGKHIEKVSNRLRRWRPLRRASFWPAKPWPIEWPHMLGSNSQRPHTRWPSTKNNSR